MEGGPNEYKETTNEKNRRVKRGECPLSASYFPLPRFRHMIYHRMVDIVQPDLHYYGGFICAMRVARMAHAAGMLCTPHMSGSGLGYLDMAHFVSSIPNPGPHHLPGSELVVGVLQSGPQATRRRSRCTRHRPIVDGFP